MLKFSTKAGTLKSLARHLTNGKILPLATISYVEWKTAKTVVAQTISKQIGSGPWIVRSSRTTEDQLTASNAGTLLSRQNI